MARNRNELLLAAVPLFHRCSDKELSHLARLTTQVEFAEGEQLTRQGTVGSEFFVLLSGTADVVRDDKVVARIESGDHVGEMALLDQEPRTATVVATSPVTALCLGYREFWDAIGASPGLDKALMVSMAHRMRQAMATAGAELV